MFKMGREKRGPLALEAWARQLTDGYPHVSVTNMSSSWRNGLAFCALIHRFRPDLIEYEKLDPADIIGNCSLAFETAESKLGIPALLDPEDMAAHEVPDRLSVLTYVAQFYSLFKNAEKKSTVPLQSLRREKDEVDLKTRSSDKSTTPSSEKNETTTSSSPSNAATKNSPSPTSKLSSSISAAKRRFETLASASNDPTYEAKKAAFLAPPPCSKCQNPVYISERTVFMKKLYHRKCFQCNGCSSMLNPHTADVSADGTSFFCISKSCQLELLKLNRGGIGGGGDSVMIKNEPSAVPSPPPIIVDITDPSSLVRDSIVGKSKENEQNECDKSTENEQNECDKSMENDNESKENVVPSPGIPNVVLRSSENDTNSVGTTFADRNLSRVSRLTARFECVQEEDIRSKNKLDTSSTSTHHHPTTTSAKQVDGLSNHNSFKSEAEYSNNSASSNNNPSIIIRPQEDKEQQSNVAGSDLAEASAGSADDNGNAMEEEVLPDSSNIKVDTVDIISSKDEKMTTEMDSARSNWLRGQIQEGVKEEPSDSAKEGSEQMLKEQKDPPPTVVVSADPQDDAEKSLEKMENSNEAEQVTNSVSVEFKLATDNDNDKEEENVIDSGISGISSITEGNVAVAINSTSQETDPKDVPEFIVVDKDKVGGEHDVFPEHNSEESTLPEPVPKIISDDETDKGTESSLSEITTPVEGDSESVVATTTPIATGDTSDAVDESQNPFEEDQEANSSKQPSKDPETGIVAEASDNAINATSAAEKITEDKSTDAVPTAELPSSEPTQEDATMKDRLTPTPRKKKRAPQPSPILLAHHSHDPEKKQPVPSPRASPRHRYSMPAKASSNLKNASSSKLEEYPTELNPFGDDEEEGTKPPPSPKPRPKYSLPTSASVNPFEEDGGSSTKSSLTVDTIPEMNTTNKDNQVNGSLPPRPLPRTSTPKPYNPFEDEDDIGDYRDDDKPTGLFAPRGSHDDTSSISSKTSDLSNTSGVTGMGFSTSSHLQKSFNASDISNSPSGSTRLRSRKSRRAPLPPGMVTNNSKLGEPPSSANTSTLTAPPSPKKVIPVSPELKVIKNQVNTKVQYRKKRRAPPPRRRVEPLPEDQIKTELTDLEVKQKELERQGISLEGNIRQLMCQDEVSKDSDSGSSEQLDEMIIQLWNIVNEKNDILRRQTELEYLRRSHRLEEMQSELEFQLRILMDTPEDQKAADHARTEQVLLDELLKLVDERNEVVDWLDYYRQMDREEEIHVSKSINEFKHQSSRGIAEMVSQLKQKAKKDKSKKEKKQKNGSDSSKSAKTDEQASGSVKSKKKDGKPSVLGVFSTLRKKTKKQKSAIGEDKDNDESSTIK